MSIHISNGKPPRSDRRWRLRWTVRSETAQEGRRRGGSDRPRDQPRLPAPALPVRHGSALRRQIASPLRHLLEDNKNTNVVLGEAKSVDADAGY